MRERLPRAHTLTKLIARPPDQSRPPARAHVWQVVGQLPYANWLTAKRLLSWLRELLVHDASGLQVFVRTCWGFQMFNMHADS